MNDAVPAESAREREAPPTPSDPNAPHPALANAAAHVERLRAEARARSDAIALLAPLLKADALLAPKRYARKLEEAVARLEAEPATIQDLGLAPILDDLRAASIGAAEDLRRQTGRALKARCDAEGIPFRVVSREHPVEIRMQPFAVVLDFEKGEAAVTFAKETLATCTAAADDVVDAWRKVKGELEPGFDAATFFDQVRRAYGMALLQAGRADGDRVDAMDVLPLLAVLRQSRSFLERPTPGTFSAYTKAHFAFDVWRLREQGGLLRDGLRLNFGVATGSSTTRKNRVIYMEDGDGVGEYKLTLFFSRG